MSSNVYWKAKYNSCGLIIDFLNIAERYNLQDFYLSRANTKAFNL